MKSHVSSKAGRARDTNTNGGALPRTDLTNFRQLYLQNYSYEIFEILTRSVFESQLQNMFYESYARKI